MDLSFADYRPGKVDYSNPRNFRQISFKSFLLIGLERWVWGVSKVSPTFVTLLGELNPVSSISSGCQVFIDLFGRRYEVSLKHRQICNDPEECVER